MRVLHLDSGTEWRGGQVQTAFLTGLPGHRLCSPRASADVPYRWADVALAATTVDLVAAHTARAHQLALGLTGRVPVVVHRRVDFRIRRRARWKYRAVEGVVAVSHGVRDVVVEAGVHPRRVFVVPDGVPETAAASDGLRDVDVLAVGALVPHKGHEVLVDACRAEGLSLAIAGTGPLLGSLVRRADGADIRFLGRRADVPDLMARSRVFAHPSLEEGLGQVVLEARAVGCRIVASAVGGIAEVAGPEALLVRPGDVEGLRRALRRTLALPRPQPDHPERYGVPHLVDQTLTAYETVLRGRR